MTNTCADTARAVRKTLKGNFPNTKFSVRQYSTSGIHVRWIDGPQKGRVESLLAKFIIGHFDGRTDCYEYCNRRADIPQVELIMYARDCSPLVESLLREELQFPSVSEDTASGWEEEREVRSAFWERDF